MGLLSSWVIAPLICIALLIGITAFYSAGAVPSASNPSPPYPTNSTVNLQILVGASQFTTGVNNFGTAINQITQPQSSIADQLGAFTDAGIAIIKVMASIPQMIGGFVWDIANAFLTVLPDDPNGTLVQMIGIVVIIAIVAFLFALANIVRNVGLGSY